VAKTKDTAAFWWRTLKLGALLVGIMVAVFTIAAWAPPGVVHAIYEQTVSDHALSKTGSPAPPPTAHEDGAQDTLFSAEKDELDYLTRIIVLMMTAVGIYTLILGLVSWKALDSQRNEFEESSKGSLANLERLRNELELDFPMLGRIQRNFKSILGNLRNACELLDVRDVLDDDFSKLSQVEIQRILFYENAITTALLLNTTGYEKELSEIYRLLGVFYGSRFYSTTGEDTSFNSSKNPEYFYRAQFYFDSAIDLDADNYNLFMHAGYFSQYYDNKTVASLSRSYFGRAGSVGTQFQKPLASLALIELEAFSDPLSTLDALKRARSRKHYDEGREYPRPEYMAYLECCALCLKARKESGIQRQSTLEEATAKLAEAADTPSQDWSAISGFFQSDKIKYFAIFDSEPNLARGAHDSIRKLESSIYQGNQT